MSYLYERFAGVALPENQRADAGSGVRAANIIELPGGGLYDADGLERIARAAAEVRATFDLTAGCAADLRETYAALLALAGTSGVLYRRHVDGRREWMNARLLSVQARYESTEIRHLEGVTVAWALKSPCWYGAAHDLTVTLNTSPKTVTLRNGGNVPNAGPVLTLTAVGTPITAVTVAVSGVSSFTWTGTLSVGQVLVMDCGARSIKQDGADAYSGFSFDGSHAIPDWLRLGPGDTSVVVTITGGGVASTLRAQYADGWA